MAVELPEAMILARQMQAELAGRTIAAVQLGAPCASLIRQGFVNLQAISVADHSVERVDSQGKWVFVRLDRGIVLLFALETGGMLRYHPSPESVPAKFHVRLDFAGGGHLTEHVVGWGWAKAVHTDDLPHLRYPGKLGPSPLDAGFTYRVWNDLLQTRGTRIVKQVLLEQALIAGIGNGYLQDILFRAELHPKRRAEGLSAAERHALHRAIRQTLRQALRLGGSAHECDLYGRPGRYQSIMGRHALGKPCPRCGARKVEKLSVLGSAVYLCAACQV